MDPVILYGFVALLAGAMLMMVLDYAIGIATVWNGLKGALRDILYRLAHPGYRRPTELPEREPDWVAAAEEVGFFDPLDLELAKVRAWTTEEREVFGINDTDALIHRIETELRGEEWVAFKNQRTVPAVIARPGDTPTARQIRRNGAQILAGPSVTYRVNGS